MDTPLRVRCVVHFHSIVRALFLWPGRVYVCSSPTSYGSPQSTIWVPLRCPSRVNEHLIRTHYERVPSRAEGAPSLTRGAEAVYSEAVMRHPVRVRPEARDRGPCTRRVLPSASACAY